MPRFAPIACAALLTIAPFATSAVHAESTTDTTVPGATVSDTSPYSKLENEPSACLNSNPRPNCGSKPQASGDRGGWMQYTVFAVMLSSLGIIGTVLARNVIKRDRAIAEQLKQTDK